MTAINFLNENRWIALVFMSVGVAAVPFIVAFLMGSTASDSTRKARG